MMKDEFEALAGYRVSFEDYSKIIEPMYMATELSKEEFVKVLDKKRFALPTTAQIKRSLRKEMREIAAHLYEICGHDVDHEAERKLDKLGKEYAKKIYGLDWTHDIEVYCFFNREYEYPTVQRGCTYPTELVIGRGHTDYERIPLVG